MLTPSEIALTVFSMFVVIKLLASAPLFICSEKAKWQGRKMAGGMERFATINSKRR